MQQGIFRNVFTDPTRANAPEIQIIPNPSNEMATVRIVGLVEGICFIRLFNEIGLDVAQYSFPCKEMNHSINTAQLPSGQYLIQIIANNQILANEKLIIIK